MSPTSSSSSVPSSAAWNLPARSPVAPVNAPRVCPNSSLSSNSPGIAEQFSGTKSFSLRGDRSWIARAASSLPVPVSPVISTVLRVGPTWRSSSNTGCIAGAAPISWPKPLSWAACSRRKRFSRREREWSSARRTTISSASTSNGFCR